MRSVNKPCVKAVQKIDTMKCYLAVARYLATLQSACELFSDNVTLWWIIANTFEHDETSVTTAYARHAGRQSTADERQRGEDDERKRTRSGGMACEVPSEYDSLDRKIKTILPSTKIEKAEELPTYKVAYTIERNDTTKEYEFITRTTDPLGNVSEQRENALGLVVRVSRENEGGKELTSATYEYDLLGQMLAAFDAKKNPIGVEYDLLGRRTALESLDGGRQEFFYDKASNLVRENNAVLREKHKQIVYEYDGLNRLTKVDYPETKDTTYTYGRAFDEKRAANKVLRVEDASGSTEFEYGMLSEVVKETKTLSTHLNNPHGYEETSVTEYRSDYLGRMQHIVYPDGEKVFYKYDAGGQVVSVTGKNFGRDFNYVTNILYDEYGQRTRIDYGNGTRTEYKYDAARRWLDSILTVNKHDEVYQNIVYDFDKVGNVRSYTNDCLDKARGNYKTRQEYEYDALYQLTRASGETTYNPYQSMNAEHVSKYEQVFAFDTLGLGNMTSKVSSASVRPSGVRLGDDLNYSFEYEYDTDFAHRLKRAGNRWYKYDSNGNVIFEKDLPEGMTLEDDENTVTMSRVQKLREDVYAIDEGWGLFATDSASGKSSLASKKNGGRIYTWNERNQLIATVDDSRSTSYVYDYNGVRTNKYSRGTETLYFNQFYSMRFDAGVGYGNGQVVKHIYLGDTRIVTKLGSVKNDSYSEEYHKQYFYHSDHLGSASLISDFEGREYQRIEYTPYGETWVEKTSNTGMEYLPYKFTGKERDEETGLYYFGARYLDPQYSRWLSTDPALGDYVPLAPVDDEARRHNEKLPGMGGVFNLVNLNLYHYGANNPITYKDPNGREVEATFEVTSYEKTNNGWMARGVLTVTDKDTGKTITANAYSGGKGVDSSDGVSLPLPLGSYDILERADRQGFFRLEANDSRYGNDQVDGVDISQGTIRLHFDGNTYGCLSVEMKRNSSEYAELSGMISGTSSSRVFVDSKYTNPLARALFRYEGITKYGTLNVVQSKDMSSNQFSKDYTHQRMK